MKGRILLTFIATLWVAIGESSNLGLLVGAGGNPLFKQGWFNTDGLVAAVADHIEWKLPTP